MKCMRCGKTILKGESYYSKHTSEYYKHGSCHIDIDWCKDCANKNGVKVNEVFNRRPE